MNIVIIEDELLPAEDLKDIILSVDASANVHAILQSVKEANIYFKNNPLPDLIFSDIQLGDGLSFEIFAEFKMNVPIIFCTAFDEYAIKAFNANGIHYILKPFNLQKIKDAFEKYNALKANFSNDSHAFASVMEVIKGGIPQPAKKGQAVLVYYQNKIIPIKLQDIALFYIKNEATILYTFDQDFYVVNKTLDELQQLDQDVFYRANRQFIVNRHAIKEATHYTSRKASIELNIPFEETITISKEKISQFTEWLVNGY